MYSRDQRERVESPCGSEEPDVLISADTLKPSALIFIFTLIETDNSSKTSEEHIQSSPLTSVSVKTLTTGLTVGCLQSVPSCVEARP